MKVKEIQAKSLLRKYKKVDSWFISCYGLNLYRGCSHNCAYCDGRAESYYGPEDFDEEVEVKTNAIEVLDKELDPTRHRKHLKKSFFIAGGGVGDTFQSLEKKYGLGHDLLELMEKYSLPVHLLTKSPLIFDDTEVISRINEKTRVLVSVSLSTVDEKLAGIFEPGVPSPEKRLDIIRHFSKTGIPCGVFLMPVLPFLSDTAGQLSAAVKAAREAGASWVVFSGLTLKPGRQRDHYLKVLNHYDSSLEGRYSEIYGSNKWGTPKAAYYNRTNSLFHSILRRSGIPSRIPARYFQDILAPQDLVYVLLDHIDHFLKVRGASSPYGQAARSIAFMETPLSEMRGKLRTISGVGRVTERFIEEILETGKCAYYEKLLRYEA